MAGAVQQQVGEQQTDLPAAQRIGQLDAADLDGQAPTKLNPRALHGSRGHGNVLETYRQRAPGILVGVERGQPTTNSAGRSEVSLNRTDQTR